MSTLAEIESAAARLAPAEQEELLRHLGAMVRRHHAAEIDDERRRKWMLELDVLRASTSSGSVPTITGDQIIDELREERI